MPAYGPLRHLQVPGRSAQVAQRQAVPATEVKGTVSLDVHSQVYLLSLLVLVLMVQSIQTCESICIHLYIYCINGTISSDMRKWIHPCIVQVRISIVGSEFLDMQEFIHPPSCIMYNYGIGFSLEYFFVI